MYSCSALIVLVLVLVLVLLLILVDVGVGSAVFDRLTPKLPLLLELAPPRTCNCADRMGIRENEFVVVVVVVEAVADAGIGTNSCLRCCRHVDGDVAPLPSTTSTTVNRNASSSNDADSQCIEIIIVVMVVVRLASS